MNHKMNWGTPRSSWTSCLPLCLALAAGSAHAAALDSDRDGLSDEQELALGLDPQAVDSNMDGIADGDAVRLAARLPAASARSLLVAVPPTNLDTDGDGIRNFLETYGYYVQDGLLVGLKRKVPVADWDAFAARGAGLPESAVDVYELAADALLETGRATLINGTLSDGSDDIYIVDVTDEYVYETLRNAFIGGGLNENSILITGTTATEGSIAWMVAFFVRDHEALMPTDPVSGKARPVFYTHPLRVSTDFDPYSDYDEVLGNLGVIPPAAPADHPLVAALPAIRAELQSYTLTEISQDATTYGSSDTVTNVERTTTSSSVSRGTAESFSVEHEWGSKSGVTWEVGVTQSNQWSTGTSVAREVRNSHNTFSQHTGTTSQNCFAKLGLKIKLENTGSAIAADVAVNLNVFFGDKLWRTVAVPTGFPSMGAGYESGPITVLGQGTDESCLTLAQTNYLEEGGVIGVETVLTEAKIAIYDKNTDSVQPTGSWPVYQTMIEQELARIDLNVTTTHGKALVDSFWVVPERAEYPNLNISTSQVLEMIYSRFPCTSKQETAAATHCFSISPEDDIALGADAAVDFGFYDESGQLLSRLESSEKYKSLSGNDNEPLSKKLAPRTIVSVVDHAFSKPEFSHIEVIRQVDSQTANSQDLVRAMVRDFNGIDEVYFCEKKTTDPDTEDDDVTNCSPMEQISAADNPNDPVPEHPFSAQYRIAKTNFLKLDGEHEYSLKAKNVGGRWGHETAEAFFLTLGEELYGAIGDYAQRTSEKAAFLESLAALRVNDLSKYNEIMAHGLMSAPEVAQRDYDEWKNAVENAEAECAYRVSSQLSLSQLAQQLSDCRTAINDRLAAAFEKEPRVYNPNKLPVALLGVSELGWKGDEPVPLNWKTTLCKLSPGEVMVGLDMGNLNSGSTPTAWVRYRHYDVSTGKLSGIKEKRCGPDTGREKRFTLPAVSDDSADFKANIVLDAGARIGEERTNGGSNGTVTLLCVSFRKFDFHSSKFEGAKQVYCNGDSVGNIPGTEADTGRLYAGNSDKALYALTIGGHDNSAFKHMRGLHVDLVKQYRYKSHNQLVSGGLYRIQNDSSLKVLTLRGELVNSRAVELAAANGSDAQVWKVEAVNDREYRLVPYSYDGFMVHGGSNTPPSVSKRADDDASDVNHAQHWTLEQLIDGSYRMLSALDGSALSNALTQVPRDLYSVNQAWTFNRLDRPDPPVQIPARQVVYDWAAASSDKELFPDIDGHDYECTVVDITDHGRSRYLRWLQIRNEKRDNVGQPFNSHMSIYLHLDGHNYFDSKKDVWVNIPAGDWSTTNDWGFATYLPVSSVRVCGYEPNPEGHTPYPAHELSKLIVEEAFDPNPPGYTFCAAEGEKCEFNGPVIVAYGANGTFNYKTFQDGVNCSASAFGDPVPGVVKSCFIPSGPPDYVICATAKQGRCSFSGPVWVAFGAPGTFTYRPITNGTYCDTNAFGDPLPGTRKSCFIPEGPDGYVICASERTGACHFSGTMVVAYGVRGKFKYKTLTNGTDCNNDVFGDPLSGVTKACFIPAGN